MSGEGLHDLSYVMPSIALPVACHLLHKLKRIFDGVETMSAAVIGLVTNG